MTCSGTFIGFHVFETISGDNCDLEHQGSCTASSPFEHRVTPGNGFLHAQVDISFNAMEHTSPCGLTSSTDGHWVQFLVGAHTRQTTHLIDVQL